MLSLLQGAGSARGGDVLVHAEEVRRVVLSLDRGQPCVILAVGALDALTALVVTVTFTYTPRVMCGSSTDPM